MNKFQPLFFMIALLATAMMIGTGIAIAYRHVPAIVGSMIAFFGVMGLGFSLKKRKSANDR
ncbi:small-conductance mechanosensitive channel [Anoxybacillus mongoliensis]|uniref:Small-conductance mechanosensitive channel n=1 Tax=Anoxybacillus mongoliensis TaxID=452565 RepID=A0A7W8JDD0_9BACL|nr:DUF5325 family protein [Anoxybacillus mongoliensis]MBB5355032.1 small-conductance mechanosensitive channel [Anoxybacillus mongoliensis]